MSKTSRRRQQSAPTQRKPRADGGTTGAAGSPGRATVPATRGEPGTAAEPALTAGSATVPESSAPAPPTTLRLNLAAGVAALEGLVVVAWGITMFFSGGKDAVLAGLLVLLFAAIPLAAAYGLRRARRWSRGPALIMQLLALPVAWTMLKSSGPVIGGGILLGALAVTGLVLLVHPATTDALGISRTASW